MTEESQVLLVRLELAPARDGSKAAACGTETTTSCACRKFCAVIRSRGGEQSRGAQSLIALESLWRTWDTIHVAMNDCPLYPIVYGS
jgi:hypothetical protein